MIASPAAFLFLPPLFEEISQVRENRSVMAVKSVPCFGCRHVSLCVCVCVRIGTDESVRVQGRG